MDDFGSSVLAMDPASRHIGWSLFDVGPDAPIYVASGTEKVPEAPPDERVMLAGDVVNALLQRCGPISFAIVEIPDFIADNAKAHIIYYWRAVGVAERVLYEAGIPIVRVAPSKDQRVNRKAVGKQRFYKATGRHPLTDDESDAYCMGYDCLAEQINRLAVVPEDEAELVFDDPELELSELS